MIAYGVCVRSQERFEQVCLTGIVTRGGGDAALLTATDTSLSAGYNDILDAAADMDGLEALVLLADDVSIEDPDFPTMVRRAVEEGTDVGGVIGASGGTGLDWWTWTERHGGLRTPNGDIRHDHGTTPVDVVDGSCLVLSPGAVDALRFDVDNFPGGQGADVDLCWEAAERGLRVDVVDLQVTRHAEGSGDRGPDHIAAAARLQAKWAHRVSAHFSGAPRDVAADPGRPSAHTPVPADGHGPRTAAAGTKSESDAPANYYAFERPELVALVPENARSVLDVGCAAGALGAAIKQTLPECEVTGIEYVQSVVDQAATRLDRAVQADLNGPIDLPFPPGAFDAMIFGDVLEHLLDPAHTLRGLLPYLAPDGVVIASIPNVKHWSVMIPALGQDQWEYTDAGLLDRTHVHLFTLREATKMFRAVGLQEFVHTGANRVPLEPSSQLDPLVAAAVAYGAVAHHARELLNCYQYLLVARRPAAGAA